MSAPTPAALVRGYFTALLVNLAIGVPTVVLVWCARWYAAHGHCDNGDLARRDLDGCTYDQIENSGFVLAGLVGAGLLVAVLVLVFDVLRPRARKQPLGPRLLTLPAVLLPYGLLATAAAG
ncbi:hypothetical protein [Streptomyces sp. NPDC088812]|uniref:hypothetical protein n=1 Tax=Streptomyces sp. NPDC088812 TaxID=3365905 RepID=UPI00380A0766